MFTNIFTLGKKKEKRMLNRCGMPTAEETKEDQKWGTATGRWMAWVDPEIEEEMFPVQRAHTERITGNSNCNISYHSCQVHSD